MSTRAGGVSGSPFDSLNLRPCSLGGGASDEVDEATAVAQNQQRFAAALGAEPVWLDQVHGHRVLRLDADHLQPGRALARADASLCLEPGIACTVLVADCLPVLLCTLDGKAVAAAHAGWRGLACGVLEQTVAALCEAGSCPPDRLLVWLGPCIGPQAFEVGVEVLLAFGVDPQAPDLALFRPGSRPNNRQSTQPGTQPNIQPSIQPSSGPGKLANKGSRDRLDDSPRWHGDLVQLARRRLRATGVQRISGGHWCTVAEPSSFFSFRRDGRTGRMAAAVALRA